MPSAVVKANFDFRAWLDLRTEIRFQHLAIKKFLARRRQRFFADPQVRNIGSLIAFDSQKKRSGPTAQICMEESRVDQGGIDAIG